MTEEELHAKAMLLGFRYHHGNGDPFFYDNDGTYYNIDTLEKFHQTSKGLTAIWKRAGANGPLIKDMKGWKKLMTSM